MAGSVVVRAATADDAVAIHALIVGLAEYEREPDAVEVTPEALRDQLGQTHPPFECVLAVLDDDAVGMALYYQTYSTWRGRVGVHLEDLFVRPEHRGYGIGRRLFDHVADIAHRVHRGRLEWNVLDWNAPAIGFYERLGGIPLREWQLWRLGEPPSTES